MFRGDGENMKLGNQEGRRQGGRSGAGPQFAGPNAGGRGPSPQSIASQELRSEGRKAWLQKYIDLSQWSSNTGAGVGMSSAPHVFASVTGPEFRPAWPWPRGTSGQVR